MPGAEKFENAVRVLYYVPQLQTGGTEIQLLHLISGLSSRFETSVWCPGPWGPVGERLMDRQVPVHRFPISSRRPHTLVTAVQRLRTLSPLIFHSFGYGTHWVDIVAARLAGIPVRLTSRRNVRHWAGGDRLNLTERIRNRFTDAVVANSNEAAKRSHEIEGIGLERIHVIPNGIPLNHEVRFKGRLRRRFGIPQEDIVIANVANLKYVKGHKYLLEAFRVVVGVNPKVWLFICGKGHLQTELEHFRDSMGLRNRVLFLSNDINPDHVYQSIDLYVHSSLAEGMPNAVLEAMGHGIAVVATSAGGTPEAVLHNRTGLLVRTGHTGELAAAILRLLRDDRLRRAMGEAGRQQAERSFSMAKMLGHYESLYLDLISQPAAKALTMNA